ncbi:MAG: 23S rRNA (guanosine-2'-O-)-methyltransferase RlmB [Phycisphaerales bacterium]|nr:23S rRNA (guanosine-2'-O-)-methyltransferase RlmB [Phycisphaerales bacterium]
MPRCLDAFLAPNVAVPSAVAGQSLHTVKIEDLADPRVADYANLKDADLARRGGLFIAEGPLVVRTLLRSSYTTRSVLVHDGKLESLRDALSDLPASIPVYTATQPVLDAITGFHLHRGVLACGQVPAARDATDLARSCRVLVVLENLTNHDNVGGLFRVAAALGGDRCGIILSPACGDPLYRKALRVSIGHALRVPYARAELDGAFWTGLASLGFTLVATDAAQSHIPVHHIAPPDRLALVLGSEGPGLTPQTTRALLAAGGLNARIPLTPGVDSLNVVVAAGVILSHLVRP